MAMYSYLILLVNVFVFGLCVLMLWGTIRKRWERDSDNSPATKEEEMGIRRVMFSQIREKERESPSIHTSQSNIIVICITGGPCAGKSSVIAKFMTISRAHDIQVYYLPDVDMTLRTGGFTLAMSQMTDSQKISYVSVLIKLQMKIENVLYSLAHASPKKALILVERGTLDYKPLLRSELWQGLLDENGWKETSLSSTRYHMVIHLETAARGATQVFNKWNEGAWTVESAMDMDLQLKEVWKNHHHFRALRNMRGMRDFENKVDESVRDILTFVNPSTYRQHKRKFLVECDNPDIWGLKDFGMNSIQTVMLKPVNPEQMGTEKVICARERTGDMLYYQKISLNSDSSHEFTAYRNLLTPKEYLTKLTRADKEIMEKVRYSFIFKTNHYTLTKHKGKKEWVLRVLTRDQEDAIQMPQFVRVIRHLQDKEKVDISSLHDEEQEKPAEAEKKEEAESSSDEEMPKIDEPKVAESTDVTEEPVAPQD